MDLVAALRGIPAAFFFLSLPSSPIFYIFANINKIHRNMKTNYQRFLDGEYCNKLDPEVLEMMMQTKRLLMRFNATDIADGETRMDILRQMLGGIGKHSSIDLNFTCQCGKHIFIGEKTIINMNCTFLDENIIRIGNNVLIAPNVQLYTATHPIAPQERFIEDWDETSGELFFRTRALPITIGDYVWIGGGSIVLPGITIGDNSIIGAGSVVTKPVPTNCVAAGNPCRVIRNL